MLLVVVVCRRLYVMDIISGGNQCVTNNVCGEQPCFDRWDHAICLCANGFEATDCEKRPYFSYFLLT